jgi:hypothetical protein
VHQLHPHRFIVLAQFFANVDHFPAADDGRHQRCIRPVDLAWVSTILGGEYRTAHEFVWDTPVAFGPERQLARGMKLGQFGALLCRRLRYRRGGGVTVNGR